MTQRPFGVHGGEFSSSSRGFSSPHRISSAPPRARRLLLIDDSVTVRAALSARLTVRGFSVRSAGTLADTNRELSLFDPEFVITDVRMPEVDGDELCKRIKAAMVRPVPVILYSSLPRQSLAERARAAGADGYVCKTEGIDALIRQMDRLLEGSHPLG